VLLGNRFHHRLNHVQPETVVPAGALLVVQGKPIRAVFNSFRGQWNYSPQERSSMRAYSPGIQFEMELARG
jgi:hypothetical protein